MTSITPTIRVKLPGNPGNMMFMYLAALSIRNTLGRGQVHNVSIPMFDISLPDIDLHGRAGLHLREAGEFTSRGLLPFDTISALCRANQPDFIQIEGYCQHVGNLPRRDSVDYAAIFPHPALPVAGGADDELVISIRGGEILRDIAHPDYVQVPIDFYADIIRQSGLKPVFFGQLGDNPYCDRLRKRFPDAVFRAGRNAAADFDFIRRSVNIIPSVSTFAWLAAWLSDAQRIFMPVLGLLNPCQHRQGMFIPYGDERFRYFLFPHTYWTDIDRQEHSERALAGSWQAVDETTMRLITERSCTTPRRIDDYARWLDLDYYVSANPGLAALRTQYGDCAVYNHYLEHGFASGHPPLRLDPEWYCLAYPSAAAALSRNEFHDALHHFVASGAALGYRPVRSGDPGKRA
jgi:hypothetical protein